MTNQEAPKKRGQGRPAKDGVKTSLYVSKEANEAWDVVSAKMGISKTAVMELALRQFCEAQGVPVVSHK